MTIIKILVRKQRINSKFSSSSLISKIKLLNLPLKTIADVAPMTPKKATYGGSVGLPDILYYGTKSFAITVIWRAIRVYMPSSVLDLINTSCKFLYL